MEIVGNGFLARNLTAHFGDAHPEVTVIAAGVSTAASTDFPAFDREGELVADVLRRCGRTARTVVLLSTASAGIYGAQGSPGTEDGPVFPRTVYGRHKLALERVCELSGTPYLIIRLTHVVGAAQPPDQLLPTLTRSVLSGVVTVQPGAHRDLLDVRHVAPTLDVLLRRGVRGEVVNLATGAPIPVPAIVDGIESRLDIQAVRRTAARPPERTVVSTEKLRTLVPEFAEHDFGHGYLDDLLDRYLSSLVQDALALNA
ncbi:NAD-dependent epimerase/dehydratase family protein [Saccharopolyspora erythraea]|uniref:NAD-dependent epimerase/dehydratase family protein n=1 Tax=Saccharopolyspora erythraea TaxID=1836 RepID=UPI001BA886F6|nr:NAD-dependent epimerase/dehydratase family protein [Saccharopolyspora erythraea]QUH01935.1 NAD-dependent epimerase/dehydratase family protein [Saccharopolyspora erythraea]